MNKVYSFVNARLKSINMNEIVEFVTSFNPRLWGIIQESDYLKINVYLTIFKDLKGKGFQLILLKAKKEFKNSLKSFVHNAQIIRPILKKWGMNQIKLKNLKSWKRSATNIRRPKFLSKVCLWVDSCDFSLIGKTSNLHSDLYWSYKNKSIGRRFQCTFDGRGRCIDMLGGYSPKIIDSMFFEANKTYLSEKYRGATLIGDGHYYASRKKVEGVKIKAPIPKNIKVKADTEVEFQEITKKNETRNKQIRTLRSRVESPFGFLKNKWKVLGETFMEDAYQLECLVFFAMGIKNRFTK
jgi:DDE superfamily endonuclease